MAGFLRVYSSLDEDEPQGQPATVSVRLADL